MIAELDFETYSEAGYVWDGTRWESITDSPPHGIGAVGAAAYTEHPSADILCAAYDLGHGVQLWTPGMWAPDDLFAHIAAGGLIEAHNSMFEFFVWNNIAVRRYGWPVLPLVQLRCSAAKARAAGIPGKLASAAAILRTAHQKDPEGDRLIKKFSVPRNPTKSDPRRRILPADDPEDAALLYKYCMRDIAAERDVSAAVPDLSPEELEVWLVDQAINARGIAVDTQGVDDCIAVVDKATTKYTIELHELTGGAVRSAGEIKRLMEWLAAQGIHTDTLDDAAVTALLAGELPPAARRALEIRAMLGSSSVKKLYAIKRRLSCDGRLRDLFSYGGALHTRRWSGKGPQPQNLPSKTAEDVDATLSLFVLHDLGAIPGDPVAAVASCLRGLFCAAPGSDLICSDYKAIEAVVLAELAGEAWRQEVFQGHGLIYEMSASKITGVPFVDFLTHKKNTGDHHPLRKTVGKVAELACFGRDTEVLTNHGYKKIVRVSLRDKLWDGKQWVTHRGVVYKGLKKVIYADGVEMTPDHKIVCGHFWKEAWQLASSPNTLRLSLECGSASLPSNARQRSGARTVLSSSAPAVPRSILSRTLICTGARVRAAIIALSKNLRKLILSYMQSTSTFCQTLSTDADSSIDCAPRSLGATRQQTRALPTMGAGALGCVTNGAEKMEPVSFYGMFSHSQAGIIKALRWTAQTAIRAMNRVTSGLLLAEIICAISAPFRKCKSASTIWNNVYDIVDVGPLSRFTIRTNTGHLLVHNSGYQGGLGAWKKFGADKFMSDEQIKQAVQAWRRESPAIVKFWYAMEDNAIKAIQTPGHVFEYRGIGFGVANDCLHIRLLSGRCLYYREPRLQPDVTPWGREVQKISYMGWNSDYKKGPPGWMRLDTYGGHLTENVVQATARDILAHALVGLEHAGYRPVLHVHDEPCGEVPEGWGSVGEFEKIMTTLPSWAATWPIKATGGWRGKRYRKD